MSDVSEMDVSEIITTPSASQEQKLLQEDNKNIPATISTALNVDASTNSEPPTNLAGLKQLIETNSNVVGAEMSMTLQTGQVIITKPNSSCPRAQNKINRNAVINRF